MVLRVHLPCASRVVFQRGPGTCGRRGLECVGALRVPRLLGQILDGAEQTCPVKRRRRCTTCLKFQTSTEDDYTTYQRTEVDGAGEALYSPEVTRLHLPFPTTTSTLTKTVLFGKFNSQRGSSLRRTKTLTYLCLN